MIEFFVNCSYVYKVVQSVSSDSKFKLFSNEIGVINYYLVRKIGFYEKENFCSRY